MPAIPADSSPDVAAVAADVDEAVDALDEAVDGAVAQMAATVRPRCPAHHPTARLLADLPLAEQLDAIASVLPCEWPAGELRPGSPAAGLLKQCAHAIRHLIGQRDRAVSLLRSLDAFDSVPNDHGYVGSPIQQQVTGLLAEVDGTPAYAAPVCACQPEPTAEAQA